MPPDSALTPAVVPPRNRARSGRPRSENSVVTADRGGMTVVRLRHGSHPDAKFDQAAARGTSEPDERRRAADLAGELTRPEWLPDDQQLAELFALIVGDLSPAAVEMVDRHAVGMAAMALRDYLAADAEATARPYLADQHGAARRNPAVIARESAAGRVALWLRELGMAPAARARMTHTRVVERTPDPVDRLFTTTSRQS